MTSPLRVLTSVAGVFAAALLVAGCTAGPGAQSPTSSPAPSADSNDDANDIEGTLLDDGRMFAVVTWGSSTCVPQVDEVTGSGQNVTVTLVEPRGDDGAEKACTADMAPRASVGALPEGVDPTSDVTLKVTYGDLVEDVDLDGNAAFAGTPGSSTEYLPSAGWVDDSNLVLLTWGSSSCPPVIESVEGSGSSGTVTFVTDDTKACTMDMAPRATIVSFGDDQIDDDGFTLTLVGGGLEGDVTVS
ncbi:hypothetical protein KZC51_05735 [Microbacterium sp. SSW1-49]|uniref:Lipoprotein n=1 Tax=Microbacterium croceum TaxID=2851645 RepID=A0ABT0FC56_9MICO|nr:hypothetical protein [Microbacterium croceum]MCK2035634.1 hypothetical protein [Microbacterium croceum]